VKVKRGARGGNASGSAQSGPGRMSMDTLNLSGRGAFLGTLDHQPKNGQAKGMTQGLEAIGVAFERIDHENLLL